MGATKSPDNPRSPFHRSRDRRDAAAERKTIRDARSAAEQVQHLDGRPGKALKERNRLANQ